MDAKFYEAEKRIKWWISGIGKHGLSAELFYSISTERLCELYNIEINYFNLLTSNKQID